MGLPGPSDWGVGFYLPTFVGGLVLFSLVRDGEVDPVIVVLFGPTGVSVPF